MFEAKVVEAIAKSIAAEVVSLGAVAPRLMNLEQAANYLGMTKDALRFKAQSGMVPIVRIDNKLRFDKHDLDRMIEDNKSAA